MSIPSEIDLTGATVVHVHPGDQLVFVIRDRQITRQLADEFKARLRDALPGVEVRLVCGVDDVIIHESAAVPTLEGAA